MGGCVFVHVYVYFCVYVCVSKAEESVVVIMRHVAPCCHYPRYYDVTDPATMTSLPPLL